MTWDLEQVDKYVKENTLDNEDWFNAEEERKIATLNVAERNLKNHFSDLEEIPEEAVYLFAVKLAVAYNDTMVQWQRGVSSFSVRGISFTFKDWAKQGLTAFIPDEVYHLVGKPRKQVKWTVL